MGLVTWSFHAMSAEALVDAVALAIQVLPSARETYCLGDDDAAEFARAALGAIDAANYVIVDKERWAELGASPLC
jgi:hypothetical protein